MKNNRFNNNFLLLQWLRYIQSMCLKNNNYSIEYLKYIAKKLNLLKVSDYVITVSGTNGKGSACTVLESILINSGYRVGLYSSPHLFNYYERIRINGKYIKNPLVHIQIFKQIILLCKKDKLSYFEFITLSALLIFQRNKLDIIILEVGLGGRLDATNIINANISIITNIGLDHTQYLGNTRYSIGYEKSGIFRHNAITVIGEICIPYSIYQAAHFFNVYLNRVKYEWNWFEFKKYWHFYDTRGVLNNLPVPKVSLPSAAIAIAALRLSNFNISDRIIIHSLKTVFLPGRFHTIYKKPRIIVDVAHNPHATYFLYQNLKKILNINKNIKVYGVFGILSDKDIKNTILQLTNIIDYWYYTVLNTDRTAQIGFLKQYMPKNSIFSISIKHILYQLIKSISKKDIILVFGSFFAVSEAIQTIRSYKQKK